jgi:O-antigen/teichoic acid export membrane protein
MSQEYIDTLSKKIASGGFVSLAGQSTGTIIRTVYHILLAKYLGAAFYGIYSLGFSILNILSTFSIMGLHLGVVRFVAIYLGVKDYERLRGILNFSLLFVLGIGIFIGFVLFSLSPYISIQIFNEPQLRIAAQCFSLVLPFYCLMLMFSFIFRGFQKLQFTVLIRDVCQPLVATSTLILLTFIGLNLKRALLAYCLSVLLSAIGAFYLFKRFSPQEIHNASPIYENKKLLRFSIPLIFVYFTVVLLNKTDIMMLGYLGSSQEVGIYSISYKIARLSFIFYAAFNSIFGPIFADLYNRQKKHELSVLFKLATRWSFTLTLGLTLIMFLMSESILQFFGEKFVTGAMPLQILALMWLAISLSGSIGNVLIMSGNQFSEFFFSVSTLILNIILNLVFIKKFGIAGAALATAISMCGLNLVKMLYVFKKIHIHPFNRVYLKPLVSALFTVFVVGLFRQTLLGTSDWAFTLSIVLIILLYFLGIIMLRLPIEDSKIIIALKVKMLNIIGDGAFVKRRG